jgi:type IV secretion system protein VirB6
MPCTTVPGTDTFAPGVIGFLDCQAQTLGAQGYQALTAPGSTVSLLLTVLLTLFAAFVGYRMLFGQLPTIREGVLACIKIGIVLTLATSWPAYQRTIYDIVLHEPAALVAEVGTATGLPGSGGGLVGRLDAVDRAFATLSVYGVGQPQGQIDARQAAPPLFIGFDTFALGASRVTFLAGAIGAFALLRIGAGFLLALGPLFVAFLLFEGTRGLFEGWVRALLAVTIGATAVSVVLGVELALLEPWLTDLLARRAASIGIIGVPAQLLAISVIFAGVLGAMLVVIGRIAWSWRLPITSPASAVAPQLVDQGQAHALAPISGSAIETRSRAAVIAEAVSAAQRRESTFGRVGSTLAPGRIPSQPGRQRDDDRRPGPATPLGHSYSRRVGTRVSASAAMRDRRS